MPSTPITREIIKRTFVIGETIDVYIEIEKDSNIKYEYDFDKNELVVDRILQEPFTYPFAYGFVPNTMSEDGDPIDVLILTNTPIKKDEFYKVVVVGSLEMEDEKGMDEKWLCVLETESPRNIDEIHAGDLENIWNFFENYKKKETGKWCKVYCFLDNSQTMIKANNYT